ncbi:unnamed protein product [Lasius platythorax]|uniref:Uncharacterized protein n=2 Tax=Lasius platythorax TaxID=488582 RepID=A0AAV2MW89_9HYME
MANEMDDMEDEMMSDEEYFNQVITPTNTPTINNLPMANSVTMEAGAKATTVPTTYKREEEAKKVKIPVINIPATSNINPATLASRAAAAGTSHVRMKTRITTPTVTKRTQANPIAVDAPEGFAGPSTDVTTETASKDLPPNADNTSCK